jgi:acyl-CoA oxidase
MVTDAANVSKKALVIAVRYAAVRRQFKVGHKEVSLEFTRSRRVY